MLKIIRPFNIHFIIESPTTSRVLGVDQKIYKAIENPDVFCSCRSFGGTEKAENGVYSVLDTKVVQTYYRPDITAGCRLVDDQGTKWDIITPPENIRERMRFLQFKIKRVQGGA